MRLVTIKLVVIRLMIRFMMRLGRIKKSLSSKKLSKSKNKVGSSDFLIPKTKLTFTKLRQVFLKAPILNHFNPECYIQIMINVLGYAIDGVLSQLTSDNLGQWYSMAFFSCKMIPIKTRYKTYNSEFLTIIEAFKIWKYYLKCSQYEILVFTNHKNLQKFINTKSLSSRQVC